MPVSRDSMGGVQLDLFAPPLSPKDLALSAPDPLVEVLVAAGLASNGWLLQNNRTVHDMKPQALPSRMFSFPVEFFDRSRSEDGLSRLYLNHPDLHNWPYVIEIFEKTGIRIAWTPHDEFGRDRGSQWRWYHAVDLCDRKHWRDLLETRNFTSAEHIAKAVSFALDYGRIDTKIAREMLAEIDCEETPEQSRQLIKAGAIKPVADKKSFRPEFRWGLGIDAAPWLRLHALELGYVKTVAGFLRMTDAGMAACTVPA